MQGTEGADFKALEEKNQTQHLVCGAGRSLATLVGRCARAFAFFKIRHLVGIKTRRASKGNPGKIPRLRGGLLGC
jgi:hypothetical protein